MVLHKGGLCWMDKGNIGPREEEYYIRLP